MIPNADSDNSLITALCQNRKVGSIGCVTLSQSGSGIGGSMCSRISIMYDLGSLRLEALTQKDASHCRQGIYGSLIAGVDDQ